MLNHSAPSILALIELVYVILLIPSVVRIWRTGEHFPPTSDVSRDEDQQQAPTEPPACPLCESEGKGDKPVCAQGEPPPRIEQSRGRPREIDTNSHYCPLETCRYYGWLGLGNVRSNGHPNSSPWRQLECVVCRKKFVETINTIFYRKKVPAEVIWQVLKALAEGLSIRAAARVFDLDPNTIERWLHQAAHHMEAVSHYLIHDLHLSQVQVDELWSLLGKRNGQGRSTPWVWVGMDPVSKLWLASVVGDRSQVCAQVLIHTILLLLAPGCLPLFLSDQWSAYAIALLTHFGQWVAVPRRFSHGRLPKPRWQVLPDLLYAQVVKLRVKGRVVSVSRRVIYGSLEAVEAVIKYTGAGQIVNTAFIERLNLTIRQHVAALGRKVIGLAKATSGLKDQLSLVQAYYNFCLPHSSLRLALPQAQPTKGCGSPKLWQPRTPAMAAGVTDRIWRMEELLLLRIPPWRQDATRAV